MSEKKDDLAELIEYLEKHYAIEQSINTKGQYDHLVKRYKQVIDYLYELQEARKNLQKNFGNNKHVGRLRGNYVRTESFNYQ